MQNFFYPTNTIIPDEEEKRSLRKYYFRLAWIVIALIFVFSILNTWIMQLSAGIIGGGFTNEAINAGKKVIREIPIMRGIYSYGFPLAGDIAALGIGLMITKIDIKKKFSVQDISLGNFVNYTALTFGINTAGSFINMIIIAITLAIMGTTLGEQQSLSNVISVNNPLWLDILIYSYICLLGPVLEELIFRGVLLEGLRKYGNAFGIITSSLLFGLMHQNIMQCIPAISVGIVWATIATKTGSLVPSIILHILNNTMSSIMMVLINEIDLTSIQSIFTTLMASMPLIIYMGITMLFRLACIIYTAILIIKHFADNKGKILSTGIYSKKRTWNYFFTSVPWIIVILYMLYNTVTSLTA